jgi:hypothetical protein
MHPLLQDCLQLLIIVHECLDPLVGLEVPPVGILELQVLSDLVLRLSREPHVVVPLVINELRSNILLIRSKYPGEHVIHVLLELSQSRVVFLLLLQVVLFKQVLKQSRRMVVLLPYFTELPYLAELGYHVEHPQLLNQEVLQVPPAHCLGLLEHLVDLLFYQLLQV